MVVPSRNAALACGAASALAVALSGAPARAATCAPVRVAEETAALPDAWRAALDALVRATAEEGLPWSCPGGAVSLSLTEGGATLTVTDARGRSVTRRVPSPDQLVPTGEAILAAPPPEAPPAPPIAPPPAPITPPPAAAAPPAPIAPEATRLYVQALFGGRVSGPGVTGWGSVTGRGILPIGPWAIGFWARYDFPIKGPPHAPAGFEMDAVSAGFALGRHFQAGPIELRVTLDPSMAVVMMEAGEEEELHPEGAKVAFRLGTTLSASFRIAGIFRGVVMIDGELAPAGITGLRKIESSLPSVPVYTAGLSLGVEAAIR